MCHPKRSEEERYSAAGRGQRAFVKVGNAWRGWRAGAYGWRRTGRNLAHLYTLGEVADLSRHMVRASRGAADRAKPALDGRGLGKLRGRSRHRQSAHLHLLAPRDLLRHLVLAPAWHCGDDQPELRRRIY